MTLPRHADTNLSYMYHRYNRSRRSMLEDKQSAPGEKTGLEPRDGIKMNRSQWVEWVRVPVSHQSG